MKLLWVPVLLRLGVFGADCEALSKLSLPYTELTLAQTVTTGSLQPPYGSQLTNLPPICRVAGVIRPTSDSEIHFEVWMPVSRWTKKFQGIGNGGFAGSISFSALADAVRQGYAAASTDTGHRGGGQDARWALHHPEKIVDFGHRAIHEMTVKAKAIVTAYYGEPPKRSYFSSCSNGGRQALMEAQRYPEDYDGIIAGAPAHHWSHLLTMAARNVQLLSNPAAYIPAKKLPAIQAAALAACDLNDQVKDGVVENPASCRFDPARLRCQGPENDQCLTEPQLQALRTIYDGLRNKKGKLLFPGFPMSGEADPGGWGPWITGASLEKSSMYAFATNFFKYMVYSDPNWDIQRFQLERDLQAAVKLAPVLDATNPDLTPFYRRGGKLILYHGWCDAAIPAGSAIQYYESVKRKMGARRTSEFLRLFLLPGVQHCAGGAGPNLFGQLGPARGDPSNNVAAALERWVEAGVAPEQIIATRQNPVRSRPICAYPKIARYKGSGSTDEAANFECAFAKPLKVQ
ncbi:MAG: tannase/feruloyl esterase family alpha/beta hydrolase [Bryobacteraceae bacterium]|nr:tannase/feruloyl esterase family alpha/beta hydrolase [Bryobacteraceae bacterium]MDW8377735.1 tannase/feruloyl esterase family alpha/beta hydrolase [Bryobacterales bacterium]